MYKITLRNSPNFHVGVNETDGFTAWGVKIMTPKTARNTDGIDPGSSRNVTIAYCSIHTGDDDVAVKSGRGVPSSNISILHNHFYTGHGMSIGSGTSGGVDHMLVDDLTIDGADNASASNPTAAAAAWCMTFSIVTFAFAIRKTRLSHAALHNLHRRSASCLSDITLETYTC